MTPARHSPRGVAWNFRFVWPDSEKDEPGFSWTVYFITDLAEAHRFWSVSGFHKIDEHDFVNHPIYVGTGDRSIFIYSPEEKA